MNIHDLTKNRAPAPAGAISLKAFLESEPPQSRRAIANLLHLYSAAHSGPRVVAELPAEITLYCESENCRKQMSFAAQNDRTYFNSPTSVEDEIIKYRCKHCDRVKTFAIRFIPGAYPQGDAIKFGELPQFGPPLPRKLLDIFEDARDLLLKGRQCENAGLGIGAMAYYRRVVEAQRDKLFDSIIRAVEELGGSAELLAQLRAAKVEVQFKKAMELVKATWPDALLINGKDPLSLLHAGVSVGLHEKSDAECLAIATAFRNVLTAIAEELSHAVGRQRDFKGAVDVLMATRRDDEK